MDLPTFAKGVCVGMVAGVVVDMVASPRPKIRKTTVGKAMQKMGNAVDQALSGVDRMMH